MAERDKNGRFVKGNTGNPRGRMPKGREDKFYEITLSTVTFESWKRIVKKAVLQAERGDGVARKWLADYLMGPPVQKQEVDVKSESILIATIANQELMDELKADG